MIRFVKCDIVFCCDKGGLRTTKLGKIGEILSEERVIRHSKNYFPLSLLSMVERQHE